MDGNDRVDILLVEDNLGDILLFTEATAETDVRPEIRSVRDGVEALKFLRMEPPFEDAPRPSIVVLDLNLPRKGGRTVLQEIKSDPELAAIPVIVLSGSDAPQDILSCYALHANAYIVKPRDLYGMSAAVRSIVEFWLQRAALPPGPVSTIRGGEGR
jgi:chemotaxis family two-component system response regulator Rcp1